jgi:hypothetical protein
MYQLIHTSTPKTTLGEYLWRLRWCLQMFSYLQTNEFSTFEFESKLARYEWHRTLWLQVHAAIAIQTLDSSRRPGSRDAGSGYLRDGPSSILPVHRPSFPFPMGSLYLTLSSDHSSPLVKSQMAVVVRRTCFKLCLNSRDTALVE